MESKFMQMCNNIENGGPKNIQIHQKNCSLVKEYGYSEDPNPFERSEMEDTFCHKDKLSRDFECSIFGIFDGHGGQYVSQECAR